MITSVVGSNNFLVLKKKQQFIKSFVEKYGDIAVENIEADTELEQARSAIFNLPFLVEKKLVIFDEPSTNKELAEKLLVWLNDIDDKIDVLIIEPKPDKRTAWYKFIQKNTKLISCDEIDENSTKKWIIELIKENNAEIDNEAVKALIYNSGLNQQQLYNDIVKLINYDTKITKDTVDLLVEPIPQDTVFALLEALTAGNTLKTVNLYESLKQSGVDANEILAMLGWQLHTLLLVKSSMFDKKDDSGLHPFVVQKNSSVASKLAFKDIDELLKLLISAELSIKKDGISASKVVGVLLYQILDVINNKTT